MKKFKKADTFGNKKEWQVDYSELEMIQKKCAATQEFGTIGQEHLENVILTLIDLNYCSFDTTNKDYEDIQGYSLEFEIEERIKRIRSTNQNVEIYHNNETGIWQYSVSDFDGFWLNSFKTQREAIMFCDKEKIQYIF